MSDETNTPDPSTNITSTDAKGGGGGDAYAAALKSITAERDALAAKVQAHAGEVAALTSERDGLKVQIEMFGKRERETAVVEAVRAKLPHLTPFEIRGTLLALHDENAIDRFSDKPDEAATAAVAALQTKAPSLLRPPAQGGGPGGVPEQKAPARRVMRF